MVYHFPIRFLFAIIFTGLVHSICNAQTYKEWMNDPKIKVSKIIEEAEEYLSLNPDNREKKFFERWKYFALRNQDSSGYLETSEDRAISIKKHLQNKPLNRGGTLCGDWEELGPFSADIAPGYSPGVGRLTSFAYDTNNHDIIIVGSETGGVWKSIDRGKNWEPLLDDFITMDVYSVAIDPHDSNVYYFGGRRGGLYKSLDAGLTWELFFDFDNNSVINKVLVHPIDPNRLFVSIEREGLYVSTNGGSTWTKISSNGFDFEFKPGDPSTIYASGRSVYRSTDSGSTWETIATDLEPFGEKMIAVTSAAPERLYVLSISNDAFAGLGISNDSGNSFAIRNPSTSFNFRQSPRDLAIAVSPINADEIHLGGIDTYRSMDGGFTFVKSSHWVQNLNLPYCHGDIDDLVFFDSTLVAVTDGGVFFAENSAGTLNNSYYTDMSNGLGIHQLYKLGLSQTNPVIITTGAQDNGSSRYEDGIWTTWYGADGMECLIQQSNTNIMLGSYQNGGLIRTVDAGLTTTNLSPPFGVNTNWITPIEQDFNENSTIYIGYNRVYKSESFGFGLKPISQDFGFGLHNLKVSPSDNKTIYASVYFDLYKTVDGSIWNSLFLPYTSAYISDIAIHPSDKNKVAFALSGVGVVITEDGGQTFSAINEGLPSLYPLCLAWHDNAANGLYTGTHSTGIYYRDDNTSSWKYFSDKLPNVEISEMEINTADNKLYAATYGRGVWRSDLYSDTNEPIQLAGFSAEIIHRKVYLSWHTFTERALDYFTVKKSTDGINWTDLETINAKGNSSVRTNYEFWDENPHYGINYYRLECRDLSNEVFHSTVVDVNLSGVDLLSIYPNPNNGTFSLYTDAHSDNKIEVTIYNVQGKIVHTQHSLAKDGVNEIPLSLDLNTGVYFLSMLVEGQVIYEGKKVLINN